MILLAREEWFHFFDMITDALFAEYAKRGISLRYMLIISKEQRDANPLTCNGDAFATSDLLQCRVVLN